MTLPSFSLYLNTNINILVADAVWASNYWAKRRKEEKNLERVSSSVRTNSSEDQHHNNHDKSFHYYNYWRSKRQLEWQGALSCSHFSFQHTVRVPATDTQCARTKNLNSAKNQRIQRENNLKVKSFDSADYYSTLWSDWQPQKNT